VSSFDVAIIGGGIIGAAAAAYMVEAGARVVLFERAAVGAGASGRNSGALQHPYDPVLAELHRRSLALYRQLADEGSDFQLASEPAGLLLVSIAETSAATAAAELADAAPELAPIFVSADEMPAVEPTLAAGVSGCLLATGNPVAPAAATHAFARRAGDGGAVLRIGEDAAPAMADGRLTGVRLASGETVAAGRVLVAAGPWTPALVPGWAERPPIRRTWGVVVTTTLAEPPGHILEEVEIDATGSRQDFAFSLVTAGGASSLGSTFLDHEPDPANLVVPLLERGQQFVPALAGARVTGVRACARPVSFDGRPLIGPVPGVADLFVCAGHGPWGISTGPASAWLVSQLVLEGGAASLPAELESGRW
jgi:glycine/D-amino acid oxidase-like deaminating enzyme